MTTCFYSTPGANAKAISNSVRTALPSNVVELNETASDSWREVISGCDIAIIDVTAANPVAFYVAGLADALGKQTILLTAIVETLPQAFQNRHVIVHSWNFDFLKAELAKLAAPTEMEGDVHDNTPAGRFKKHFGDLLKAHGYEHHGSIEFDGATFTLHEQDMELALVQEIARRAKSLNLRVRLL